jgi:hypothetical protein
MSRRVGPGAVLVAFGILWLLSAADAVDLSWGAAAGILLVVIGLAIALDPGHAHGLLVVLGVLVALAGLPALAVDEDLFAGGVGDRRETPSSPADVDDPYRLAMGQLVLDLTLLQEGDVEIEASVGMGQLQVHVPATATVTLDAHVGMGNVSVFGADEGGIGVDVERELPGSGEPRLELELDVGMGEVRLLQG